jgi:hypothetical protein
MDRTIVQAIEELHRAVAQPDFLVVGEEVTKVITSAPNAIDAVGPILRLMEQHEDVDFGSPGPLVHFVEQFVYVDQLLESLARHPTTHTVWMLNRIINRSEGKCKSELVMFLQGIVTNSNVTENAREHARRFVKLHTG